MSLTFTGVGVDTRHWRRALALVRDYKGAGPDWPVVGHVAAIRPSRGRQEGAERITMMAVATNTTCSIDSQNFEKS